MVAATPSSGSIRKPTRSPNILCPPIDRTPANPYPDSVDPNPEGISDSERKFLEDHGSNVISAEFYEELVAQTAELLLPLIETPARAQPTA